MKKIAVSLTLLVIFALSHVRVVSAQWETRLGLPPVNPNSGLEMNPRVFYDPSSGAVLLGNTGSNGSVDSTDNSTLQGDDVGMVSIVMTFAPATTVESLLPIFADGIAWAAPVYFDGRLQLSGNAVAASFLPIRQTPTEIFRIPAGLAASNFIGDSGLIEIEMGINFAFAQPGLTLFSIGDPIASGAFEVLSSSFTNGDFNNDLEWDCDDVDSLVAEIVDGNNTADFDLTGDSVVDDADLDYWLTEAGRRNLPSARPYLPGDANLDGDVDVSDFNIWNATRFSTATGWCLGDFNADGAIDASDFNVWNERKFTSSDAAIVPEPGLATLLITGLLGFVWHSRRQ